MSDSFPQLPPRAMPFPFQPLRMVWRAAACLALATLISSATVGHVQSSATPVTVDPPLWLDGHHYVVAYSTDGAGEASAFRLFDTTAEAFAKRRIKRIIVTRDGERITDADELTRVFLAYTAATHLYKWGPDWDLGTVPESFRDDVGAVLNNPFFWPYRAGSVLEGKGREFETLETFRAILASEFLSPETEQLVDGTRTGMDTVTSVAEAFDRALVNMRWADSRKQRDLQRSARELFAGWDKRVVGGSNKLDVAGSRIDIINGLDLVTLGVRLMVADQLSQDRAGWLSDYLGHDVPSGGDLDDAQTSAAWEAIEEASEAGAMQRHILVEFAKEKRSDLIFQLGEKVVAERVVKWAAHKYGLKFAVHHVVSAANAFGLAFILGDVLIGADDLVSHMLLAERSDELRLRFCATRLDMQRQVRAGDPPTEFNGDLAFHYRSAYMLEALAAAQAHRSYADGSDAVLNRGICGLFGQLELCRTQRAGSAGLRALADTEERIVEAAMGHPEYVAAAVWLATDHTEPPQPPQPRRPRLPETDEYERMLAQLTEALSKAFTDAAADLARQLAEAGRRLRAIVRGGPPPTPIDVSRAYMEAVGRLDISDAVKQFRPQDRLGMRLVHGAVFTLARSLGIQLTFEQLAYEVVSQTESTATVRVRGHVLATMPLLEPGDVSWEEVDEVLPLVRDGDEWYLKGSDEINALLEQLQAAFGG